MCNILKNPLVPLGQHWIWYLQIVMHSVMSLRLIGVITNLYIVLLITRSLDRNLRFERSVADYFNIKIIYSQSNVLKYC